MLLQVVTEVAENPTLWAWVQLVGGILLTPGAITLAFALYKAWKRGELAKFLYKTIDGHKKERAEDGEPESAKALTRLIGAGLDARPDLQAEHKRLLKAAAANADSILGPAIAKLARG